MDSAHRRLLDSAAVSIRETHQHLTVIESKISKDGIDRELRQIDRDLFVDAEWDSQFGRLVYTVKFFMGHGTPPVLITDWREPTTRRPLELSSGLLHKVGRMASERGGTSALKRAAEENAAMQAYHERQKHDERVELVEDMVPRMKGTKGTIMPRAKSATGAAARRQARRDLERRFGLR